MPEYQRHGWAFRVRQNGNDATFVFDTKAQGFALLWAHPDMDCLGITYSYGPVKLPETAGQEASR